MHVRYEIHLFHCWHCQRGVIPTVNSWVFPMCIKLSLFWDHCYNMKNSQLCLKARVFISVSIGQIFSPVQPLKASNCLQMWRTTDIVQRMKTRELERAVQKSFFPTLMHLANHRVWKSACQRHRGLSQWWLPMYKAIFHEKQWGVWHKKLVCVSLFFFRCNFR